MTTVCLNWKGYSVHGNVREIDALIADNAFIKIEKEDVVSLFSEEGENYVAAGNSPSLEDAFNQAAKNLGCPPEKIRNLLMGFRCGSKQPDMMELTRLTTFITALNPDVSVKWGIGEDPSLVEDFKVILLASK